jgi:ribonuclease Z
LTGLGLESRAPIPLEFAPMSDGGVIQEDRFTVTCFRVRHRETDSIRYSFQSLARRHLDRGRLAVLGVPDGPVRGELAEGQPVTLPDGRVIDPAACAAGLAVGITLRHRAASATGKKG